MSQAAAQQPSRKKAVISLLVLLALTCIIVFTFKDHWAEITAALAQLSVWQVLAVLAVGISYPLLEGCVAWVIVRSRLPQFTLRQGLDVGWCGTFGNVVTLGAGAVPVQLYYLHRAGLPLGPGAGLMTLEYVFHKSTVLLYATVMLLLQHRWLAANTTGVMRYHIIAGDAVEHQHAHHLALLQKAAEHQQKGGFNRAHPGYIGQGIGDEEHQAGEQLHLPEAQRGKPHEPDAQVGQAEQPEQLECLQGKNFQAAGLICQQAAALGAQHLQLFQPVGAALLPLFGLGQKAQQPAGEVLHQRRDAQQHQRHNNYRYHSVCHGQIFAASAAGFFIAQRHLAQMEPPKEG